MFSKTILITGSTDGLGLHTAERLVRKGHFVLLHGKNSKKLQPVFDRLSKSGKVDGYLADLSDLKETKLMIEQIQDDHGTVDVVINNAGVFNTDANITKDGLDIRFMVNAISPYMISKELITSEKLDPNGRIVNITSAAQEPVSLDALNGKETLEDPFTAYSQSKQALSTLSYRIAKDMAGENQTIISVNPGSLLATKMVKEGFGMEGKDISIGSDIMIAAALEEEFIYQSGQHFDNDKLRFLIPPADVTDPEIGNTLIENIENIIARLTA